MTLVDRLLAERIWVVYTGRVLSLVSTSGHILKALEAVVPVLEVEGEVLKYEAIAVSDIPEDVKKVLKETGLLPALKCEAFGCKVGSASRAYSVNLYYSFDLKFYGALKPQFTNTSFKVDMN